ncbi:MAG TPA: sigma factor, partial [Candidatus Xenobia bacterium]
MNGKNGGLIAHIHELTQAHVAARQEDALLIDRFVRLHEETAFEALMRRHGPMVFRVCQRVLGQVQDAEDVFQATFLLLSRKASSLRDRGAVGSWLYGVAYRLARKARTAAQ